MNSPKTSILGHAFLAALSCGALMFSATLQAEEMTFNIDANGANEVTAGGTPNQGDPDGFAIGTITFNNGTGSGTTGSALITLTMGNIDLSNLTGHHIHQAPSTTNGPIVINFGDPDTIRSGSTLSGTITGLSAATITSIFANPDGFYYNLHNGTFPGGAVRDQLQIPEPGTTALFAFGAAGLFLAWRKRTSRV